ncbi:lipopolysaccharide biosynthesis protein [Fodinibius salsisoli]|uniref:Polysaccharide biosynthesis C-terminal domain-containing protein n=1 Tax=Fodinibius salsisoli TaxID=2820877 RepID=A0ABT3PNY4_9BACT|nr:oligosaccharide flippase family protein [Fodinibius salsisoli]MCW9707570.1 polysaccharide biosynthesis C-terminal domain-containing protein [Fodinibius salsisoli]
MKKLKELLSDTLVYGISSVLARFINYLLVPFYTDVFRADQYGIVGLVYAAIIFLNVIFTFGMESAYLRYAKDREKAQDVFKTLQVALLVVATILAVLLWLFAPALMPLMSLSPEMQNFYFLMIGIIWFDTLGKVPFAELRLVRKSVSFAVIRTADVLLNIGLNFYFILGLGWGIEAVFIANLIASAVTTIVLWILTRHMLRGSVKRSLFDKALAFGLPFIPGGLGYAINESLDRFLLNNYLPEGTIHQLYGSGFTHEAVVGIYNACYKLGVFMLLVVTMFKMAWQPFFLRHADDPESEDLYREVFRYFNAVAGICFLIVALFIDQIVQIKVPVLDAFIIGKEYWLGLNIVPLLLAAYWFQGWYMNFSAGIFIREKTKVLPVITLIGAAVTIAGNLLLLPYLGMMGSAAATLISYAAMALLLYQQSVKVYQVNYQMGRAFGMIFITVACLLLQPYLNQWIVSEWTSRLILLLVGSVGLILLAWPTSEK